MTEGSKSGIFAFDQFRLDGDKLMLYRDGIEVSIPPKVAKTLAVLVESAGTIISKDEMIERVWDDSIVEESNLTQYLYLLRKVLGTTPDGRPYIETLRRRGYRFNGAVERLVEERPEPKVGVITQPHPEHAASFGGFEREGNVLRLVDWKPSENPALEVRDSSARPTVETIGQTPKRKSWITRVAIGAVLLAAIGGGGILLWPKLMPAASNAESPREISVIRLTNGQVPSAATISPDGNTFAYTESDGDIFRFFVQQTGQTSRIEVASSADKILSQKTFSPDGQTIYYLVRDKKTGAATLHRIPTMGGAPVKVLDDISGSPSFSPDGKEMVFGRINQKTNESWLMIADRDGRAERVLVQRKSPLIMMPTPAWSPDGRVIVFSVQDVTAGAVSGDQQLHMVSTATGQVTSYSSEAWDNVLKIEWSPDGSGVVIIGTRANDGYSTRRDQIYFVSYPDGKSQRITNEGHRHEPESLGVTKKGEIFAVPSNRSSQLWVMNADGNTNSAVQLTRGAADGRAGIGPLPDGRFGYLARTAEEITLMVSNPDASNVTQLATGFQFIEELRSDPLGKFFVFSSMKDGKNHMFRIDIESGAIKQLTFGNLNAIDSTISPDGKYLTYDASFYENGVQGWALRRVPIEGGDPVTIKSKGCLIPTYSPDGSLISCVSSEKFAISVVSATDGSELETHPLPIFSTWNFGIGWTPDGSGLIYIVNEKGVSNLWVQPRDGGKPRSLTNFSSGIIYRYVFARDGSKLYLARGYPTQDAILIKNYR